LLQTYVEPPDAVSVVPVPPHKVVLPLMETDKLDPTFTVMLAVFVQTPLETETE
jgi:hypothetical protein